LDKSKVALVVELHHEMDVEDLIITTTPSDLNKSKLALGKRLYHEMGVREFDNSN
jgi:hypothetical protein